ncbi:hypothetical protein AYO44_10585 [Planctomycetaceae bacterium SCGC AG-212-F19]|nr:hypothetical protein AYO44_10585 [Planctomycetaceae bacterium SCGC AG-212-F19]
MFPSRANRIRRAYSLIELVVVLTILASLAGLTVSIVGWLKQSADKGTAAHTMGSLLSNIELYHVSTGAYPNQFDSLLDGTGNLYAGNGTTDFGLHTELRDATQGKITSTSLDANMLKALSNAGILAVMDHLPLTGTETIPGNTGSIFRALAAGGKVATINSSSADGQAIIDAVYPPQNGGVSGSGLPANIRLLVFGFGPRCTSVGKTIVAPPSYSGVGDVSTIYNRFLCVFAVPTDGSETPAQLKTVIDSKGDFLNQELAEFYRTKPQ